MEDFRGCAMIWMLLLASTGYALLRYAVFGPGLGHPAPVWILNKALGLASVGCLLLALRARGRAASPARSWWGPFGHLALLHIVLSLALFAPAHYPGFFRPDGSLSLEGSLVVLGGATASLAFLKGKASGGRWAALGALLLLPHLAGQGMSSWTLPRIWPGHLPPISLLGAIAAAWAASCGLGVTSGASP